jgi:tRNA dimethylallyltransferase
MTDNTSPCIAIVAGPTASGKSALALALAEELGGTVINADSMQIYRDLPILTAQPENEAMARAPHRLYGVLDGAELCSAARWAELARGEIDRAVAAGSLPIVTGGTGLYLRTLMQGIAAVPDIPADIRHGARALHAEIGGPAFHGLLGRYDPEGAARLHPSDSQRLIRAYEVAIATGRPLSSWHRAEAEAPAPYQAASIVLMPPRDLLYAMADQRFVTMIEAGAIEEVRRLLGRRLAPDLPVMKALGVPELARHLAGEIDLATAIQLGQKATRNYAKRQTTWFRHQMPGAHIALAQFSYNLAHEFGYKVREMLDRPESAG